MLLKSVPVLAALYVIRRSTVSSFSPDLEQLRTIWASFSPRWSFSCGRPSTAQAFHRDAIAQRPFAPMASTDDVIEAQWRHG